MKAPSLQTKSCFRLVRTLRSRTYGSFRSIDRCTQGVQDHVQDKGWTQVRQLWCRKDGVSLQSSAAQTYGIKHIPTALLVGADRRIEWRGHPEIRALCHGLVTEPISKFPVQVRPGYSRSADLDKQLEIRRVPLDSLHVDPANARIHDDRNLEAIKGSLARFGLQKPIVVDRRGMIRAGNGTFLAAKALGWKTIPIVETDLEGLEAAAYAIADNRTSDLSEFDLPSLGKLLEELRVEDALDGVGYDEAEIDEDPRKPRRTPRRRARRSSGRARRGYYPLWRPVDPRSSPAPLWGQRLKRGRG